MANGLLLDLPFFFFWRGESDYILVQLRLGLFILCSSVLDFGEADGLCGGLKC